MPDTLSPDDRREIDFLLDEVRRMHTEWDAYEQLYLAPGRDALRKHAGNLFAVLDVALATDMVLTISRLCDPVGTGERLNLVLQRFAEKHPAVQATINKDADELLKLYESDIKPVRNKRLGHNDLRVLQGAAYIQSPRIAAIRRAIDLCTEIVTVIVSELKSAAIGMTPSTVPGEVDWIEAALRLVDQDRLKIKPFHEAVRNERLSSTKAGG